MKSFLLTEKTLRFIGDPVEFAERYLGLQLFEYQKTILRMMYKTNRFITFGGVKMKEWDIARLKYYRYYGIMPPELTKADKKAYKKARSVRDEIRRGPKRDFHGRGAYALLQYNNAVADYKHFVGFLRSNGYKGCNYYWDEDLYEIYANRYPWSHTGVIWM